MWARTQWAYRKGWRELRIRLTALRTSFWPVPAACAAGAILLAIGLSVLELRVGLPFGNILPSGLAGARSLLSSIITAIISFTALVFSITVVALQLASSQYSPRVLRTFLQDRVTQFTLGTFLATALFAMVVLAVERQAGQDVGFGFRQLADIAERALSPGLNDTTTAVRAIQEAHDVLRRLAARPQHPWLVRDDDGTLRVHATPQSFDSFLAVAIDDVRRAGRDQPRVTRLLDAVLADLRTVALPEHLPDILRRLNP